MKNKFDVTDIVIETERLILRPWDFGDLEDLFEYARVEGVGELAGWNPHKTIDESKKVLQTFVGGKDVFAVVLKENQKVIGSFGMHGSWAHRKKEFDRFNIIEFGAALSRAYWGRGLIPEVTNAVIDYCFSKGGFDAITICHFISNTQSGRVIEKCGFSFCQEDNFYSKNTDITYREKQYILFKGAAENEKKIKKQD